MNVKNELLNKTKTQISNQILAKYEKEEEKMIEKTELLNDIKCALHKLHYTSSITGFDKTLMPHHKVAIMNYITPVIDNFFNNCFIQSKKRIWHD